MKNNVRAHMSVEHSKYNVHKTKDRVSGEEKNTKNFVYIQFIC